MIVFQESVMTFMKLRLNISLTDLMYSFGFYYVKNTSGIEGYASSIEMPNGYNCFIIMTLSRIILETDDIQKCVKWSGICTSLLIILCYKR